MLNKENLRRENVVDNLSNRSLILNDGNRKEKNHEKVENLCSSLFVFILIE